MHLLKTCLRLSLFAAFATSLSVTAVAQNAASSGGNGTAAAGQKVAIDRQTGRLRPPTPDESRRLSAAMQKMINRSSEGLTVVQHPNGMKSVNLEGRFQSLAVAEKDANGNAAERCVTNKAEVNAFTKVKPRSKTAEVK